MTSMCHFMLIIVVFSLKIYQLTYPEAIFLIAFTKIFQKKFLLPSHFSGSVQRKSKLNII